MQALGCRAKDRSRGMPRARQLYGWCVPIYSQTSYTTQCTVQIAQLFKKKNEIKLFAATWMDLEVIILSKVSQKEKDKHHTILLMCGI